MTPEPGGTEPPPPAPGSRQASPPPQPAPPPRRSRPLYRRPLVLALMWAVLATAGFFGARHFVEGRALESTDDAFLEAHVIPVAPRVAGQVKEVCVRDNQDVGQDELLVALDARSFEIALERAKASLASSEAAQKSSEIDLEKARAAQVTAERAAEEAGARVKAAESTAGMARIDLDRTRSLSETGVASPADLDSANTTYRTAAANLEAARQALAAAES